MEVLTIRDNRPGFDVRLTEVGVVAVQQRAQRVQRAAGQRLAADLHDVVVQQRLVVVEVGRVRVKHVAQEGGAGAPRRDDDGAHRLPAQLGHQLAQRPAAQMAHSFRADSVSVFSYAVALALSVNPHVLRACSMSRQGKCLYLEIGNVNDLIKGWLHCYEFYKFK